MTLMKCVGPLAVFCARRGVTAGVSVTNAHQVQVGAADTKLEKDRQPSRVTVVRSYYETPLVKLIRLKVEDEAFNFQPGQWVDFFAPGVDTVGGYSICSSPQQLAMERTIDLAVKKSKSNRCAHWVHAAVPGDVAHMRVGGAWFATDAEFEGPLLLIAGGIGISPIYSILKTFVERQRQHTAAELANRRAMSENGHAVNGSNGHAANGANGHAANGNGHSVNGHADGNGHHLESNGSTAFPLQAVLLYSAREMGSHAMAQQLKDLAAKSFGRVKCVFHVTSPDEVMENAGQAELGVVHTRGRVDTETLKRTLDELTVPWPRGQPTAFLCGPPAMSDAMEAALLQQGLPKASVRLERWW